MIVLEHSANQDENRMSNSATLTGLQFLRPYLHNATSGSVRHRSSYLRLFSTTCCRRTTKKSHLFADHTKAKVIKDVEQKAAKVWGYEDRVAILKEAQALDWPRMQNVPEEMTIAEFIQKYKHLKRGATTHHMGTVVIRGRCACSPRQTPLLIC